MAEAERVLGQNVVVNWQIRGDDIAFLLTVLALRKELARFNDSVAQERAERLLISLSEATIKAVIPVAEGE